jgi:protein-disulfide isomerase
MRSGFVIFIISAIGFIYGCNQVEDTSDNSTADTVSREPIRTGPAIEFVETEIDLGRIPAEDTEVFGKVLLYNPGSESLAISKVTGPCSCFIGSAGDKLILPGESGEVTVQFDTNKIEAGRVRKLVNLETNVPKNKIATAYFNFTIERDPVLEQLRVLRAEVSAIRYQINHLGADIRKMQTAQAQAPAARPAVQPKTNRPPPDTTVYTIDISDSPVLGAKEAVVTIVEFGDFQCPYCVREFPKIKQILQQYPDQVRFVLKHYPLRFHKKAPPAHAAAELARREQGPKAFWKMHDLIMANPKKLEIADLRSHAQSLKLDLEQFDAVMADPEKIAELLKTDLAEAKKCKVRATPTVLINGLKMTNRTLAGYQARIYQILKPNVAAGK